MSRLIYSVELVVMDRFLARLLIKKGGLLQLKFGVVSVGVGVNIYLWARLLEKFFMFPSQICFACY